MDDNEEYMELITDDQNYFAKRIATPTKKLMYDLLRIFEQLSSKKLKEEVEIVDRFDEFYPVRLKREE